MVTAQKGGDELLLEFPAMKTPSTGVKMPCHTSLWPASSADPAQPHWLKQSRVLLLMAPPSVSWGRPGSGTLSSVAGLPSTTERSSTAPEPTAKRWARPLVRVRIVVTSSASSEMSRSAPTTPTNEPCGEAAAAVSESM